MRIISGTLKGRPINFLKNLNTRPLKDAVKENIFNILSHSNIFDVEIKGSKVLDLYSGVGSFGIECISRGAKKVTFIEKNMEAISFLKENLLKLSILDNSIVFNDIIENVLNYNIEEKFNIFFLDPPFSDLSFLQNIKTIKEKKIYTKKHLIIIHRENKINDDFKDLLKILDSKKYGRSKIIFAKFN